MIIEEASPITIQMLKEHLNLETDDAYHADMRLAGKKHTDETERALLLRALEENGYNVSAAARTLGISRNTLYNRMRRYGCSDEKPTP